ncbi:SDR family oxidoreductase [Skermanella mucosa]|uniref:SDR family NAD(P)-dependent oxidoreductase n=1 Tax=Skermanella mucosa TaxID=1789672 RepID=UPI00192A9955|nr:SDR family NAD(P)-dependent oxidoreductase [Skermanella mucosa]UEM21406.1 SDR family oxidoreductase [Skermanella mucosa]
MTEETRVALVTGASRGIGKAIATALAEAGFDLLITSRTATALETLASHLARETGQRIEILHGDLREPDLAETLVETAVDLFGRLDLLVNNAGATKRGPFLDLAEDDWQDGFALKFFGAVRLSRASWPHLKRTGGQVINIIGSGGRTPTAEFTIGGSVNAGLMNFTKALADLGLADGVRVNGINPGPIRTERLETRIRQFAQSQGIDTEEAASRMVQAQKVMRFGEPDEIASVVEFLAGEGGEFIHGALIDVDGGSTKGL